MAALSIVLKHLELALRLQAAAPWMPPPDVYAHIAAAEAAATERVTGELLLGIAFIESRFDATAVSRVEGRVRRTGRYPWTAVPPKLDPRASLYCGPLQTFAPSWSACLRLRDLKAAYAAGAAEIERWLNDRRVRGNVSRALAGHGCGNHGVATAQCNGYPVRVLWMEQRLRAGAGAGPRRSATGSSAAKPQVRAAPALRVRARPGVRGRAAPALPETGQSSCRGVATRVAASARARRVVRIAAASAPRGR
ncbi:MAG TPA: hypothetical protein VFK02_09935 [Kofleriaceae bacterium]|nr:hypothetical protein [Kofleriaceae bacterium]